MSNDAGISFANLIYQMKSFQIILLFLPSLTFGQTYDGIFGSLKSNPSQAEILLKKYVTITKDNPSAYLELGNIYYSKALESYIADEENEGLLFLDSAVTCYHKSSGALTANSFSEYKNYFNEYNRGNKKKLEFREVQKELDERIRKINRKITRIQKRGGVSEIVASNVIKPNGKYYALIIGVSKYQDSKLNLDQPTKDALELKNVIINRYSFDKGDVQLLLNPTRQNILKEFVKLRRRLTEKDNLLIFYGGHGYWDEDAKQGYWWPTDATQSDPTFWLSNSDLRDQVRSIRTAHTLLISDACFSGGILKTRNAGDIRQATADIILLYKQPSRRVMTSGSMTAVPDRSVFFHYLKTKLETNTEKFVSSQSLFDQIRQAVINNSLVVPQDGVILDTGDQGGDFIFIKR